MQPVQEKSSPAKVPLGAFVSAEQRAALIARAAAEDRSVSSLVRIAIADYLDRKKAS